MIIDILQAMASRLWVYYIAYRDAINGMVLVIGLYKIFEGTIITSSFCFVGIIRCHIILCYLLAVHVLRLL